jgi:hypothetical protein
VIVGVISGIGIAAEGIAQLKSGVLLASLLFLVLGIGISVTFGLLGAVFVAAPLLSGDEARQTPSRISGVVRLSAAVSFSYLPILLILVGTGPGGVLMIWKGISLVKAGIIWPGISIIVMGFIVVLMFLSLLITLVWFSRAGQSRSKHQDASEESPGMS